jgi:hypothetical protein
MKIIYGSSLPIEDDSNLGLHRQPQLFRESAAKHRLRTSNATLGCKFTFTLEDLTWRIIKALRDEDPNQAIVLTDAWDVFFCARTEEIKEKFLSFNKPIVLSMETNLYPAEIPERFGMTPDAPTRWRYINGGQMAGYAGALADFWENPNVWTRECCCNQEAYNRWWILHPDCPGFALDFHCKLFCAIYDNGHCGPAVLDSLVPMVDASGQKRIFNKETGEWPCSIHGNGGRALEAMRLWRSIQ